MKFSRINIGLAVVLLVVVMISAFVDVDHSRPNYEIHLGDDMTYSPAYGAFAPNENFADGRTLQSPVPGTIARGEMPFHFKATPEDAIRAGQELVNPHEPGGKEAAAAVDRGAEVYRVSCVPCHGGGGAGDGPVAKRGFPPPASLLTGKSLKMKDGQLFHILTLGQASMPSFAAQLSADRRWDVIHYIRKLQQDAPQPTPPETTDSQQ